MEITSNHMTIAHFCERMENQTISINRKYQRQPGVWPQEAQSFLIETILLSFPVPKLAIHSKTDRDTRRTTSEIVDGQQRATAINAFLNDEFKLSRNLEIEDARGHTYSSLPDEYQQRFLSYQLGMDELVNVDEAEIREIFRRINSYEVPLNPEEQRHAKHQGPFKWFIYRLARESDEILKRAGTFTERSLIRMADMKLLAEVCHALVYGISTTNKASLSKLYHSRDVRFAEEKDFTDWLQSAISYVGELSEFFGSELMKPYSVYSLVLAHIHAQHDVDTLREIGVGGRQLKTRSEALAELSILSRSLAESEESPSDGLDDFRDAFEKGTNVAERRLARASHFLTAISAK